MRKIHSLSVLFILTLLLAACVPVSPADSPATDDAATAGTDGEVQELVVSTWGFNMETIDANFTKPFEEMYNVKVVYETGNNSDRLSKLVARKENPNVDVVHFAGAFTFRALEEGLLQPLDPSLLSNYDELYDWAQDPYGNNAGVSYAISSYLLIYRTDKISEPVTSWADLLREDVKGFVSVPELATTNGPATIVMLAQTAGGDIDNPEPGWELAAQLADQVVTTYSRSSELTSLIQEEEVWLAPYSSFAIGNLLGTGHPLEMVIPTEGVPGAPSVVSIVAGSEKADLAHKYIDFLISAEVQSAMAENLIDSPTNQTVVVSEENAPLLTYGEEMLGSLIFLDQSKLNENQDVWLERWTQIMQQ